MKLKRVFTGASPILIARVLQLASSFAISVFVIATYGLGSAGALALAALPAALGGHLACLGLQNALPRSQVSDAAKATIGATVSAGMALLILPGIAIYAYLVAHSPEEALAIAALSAAGAFAGHNNVAQMLYVLQGRQRIAPLAPGLYLVGIALAALAPSFAAFALLVLGARVLSTAAGFVALSFARTRILEVRGMVSDSVKFAPLDIAGLLADQLPIVLVSSILTREELGLLGLLRQFVTVADTPGYSLVFNSYPDLVRDPIAAAPRLALSNEKLGWASAAGTFVVAAAAAFLVYRLPILVAALPIVLLTVPARYMANFCEQALRATGRFRDCMVLAMVRIAYSIALFLALAAAFGYWGAVVAFALNSLAAGLLFRWAFLRHYPGSLHSLVRWPMFSRSGTSQCRRTGRRLLGSGAPPRGPIRAP